MLLFFFFPHLSGDLGATQTHIHSMENDVSFIFSDSANKFPLNEVCNFKMFWEKINEQKANVRTIYSLSCYCDNSMNWAGFCLFLNNKLSHSIWKDEQQVFNIWNYNNMLFLSNVFRSNSYWDWMVIRHVYKYKLMGDNNKNVNAE
jgi:hypothetical protein